MRIVLFVWINIIQGIFLEISSIQFYPYDNRIKIDLFSLRYWFKLTNQHILHWVGDHWDEYQNKNSDENINCAW